MCIIAVKPKGKEMPSIEVFRNCWDNNRDGAGVMYNKKNKVIIHKGFMSFKNFEKFLKEINKEIDVINTTMVFHFRISTSGNIDMGNCHPYPISNSNDELRSPIIETDLGIAHNGIIRNYNGLSQLLNDTQLFIKNELFELYSLDKEFYFNSVFKSMIEKLIDGSRMVFLNGNGEIELLGRWVQEDGYYFSNYTYALSRRKKKKEQELMDISKDGYEINGDLVDEDDFEEMMDYLEKIPYGKKILSKDGLDEYSWNDENIYIDTIDNSIYYVENHSISYIGEYA